MPHSDAQRERQLQLIMALDKARDALAVKQDPAAMFQAIAQQLKQVFHAESCAIMILTEKGEKVEHIASAGQMRLATVELCHQAARLNKPQSLNTDNWTYTLGLQIRQDETAQILGGMFIARNSEPFTPADEYLFGIAETQIDSAVIQARYMWDLANRNRELEAIYRIDRMRDSNPDENDLIHGFTGILTEYFKADLCLVMLTHIDNGELVARSLVNKYQLTDDAMKMIRALAAGVTSPRIIPSPPEINQIALLAAPLIVSNIRLGVVLLGRDKARSFTPAEHRLLDALISQMDSAIAHSRVIQQLMQRNRELETIYKIDSIRDKEEDLDIMLQQVLNTLCRAISTEMGYLMLFSESDDQRLELRAVTKENLPENQAIIERISQRALKEAQPVYSNEPQGQIRSIVAVPLVLNSRVIGVFGAVNSTRPYGFTAEDRRMIQAITSQIDTAIFERLERRRMRRVLSRSVDPKVIEHLLNRTNDNILTGERVIISALFADLRGSTEWAERTQPEQIITTLNRHLGKMTEIIFRHGGTLDKFVGDEVIALFGTPISMPDHAVKAVRCAQDMIAAHAALTNELALEGVELPAMGIGISTGEVIAGEVGSPVRTDFTAIGRIMNLGSRLCGIAPGGQIFISQEVYDIVHHQIPVQQVDTAHLKGIGDVQVYRVSS
ncbi:MAG: hypothetical protein CUN56_06755 [Phototrophicales bacterium]|nr:MAG: hypothetical protein CUN56_06755 [Phototrophicales bacterium]RMG72265.1 MAG: GAF domain-containing protein [Chloroflexota bacterium]